MTFSPGQLEAQRARCAEGMAAARAWREARKNDPIPKWTIADCRCEGTGMVWWLGKPGEGGRLGPCPRCQREGAQRFSEAFNREVWGDPDSRRAKRFNQIFTQGEEHGRQ